MSDDVPITEWLENQFPHVVGRYSDLYLRITCPKCLDPDFSLWIRRDRDYWRCECGYQGNNRDRLLADVINESEPKSGFGW